MRSVDFARDGVGSASVGSWVQDAASEAAFLKYAIDRSRVRGDAVALPPNAAPAGGFGAMGAFTRERLVDGAIVFEDVFVTATVGAAPRREERIDVFALRSTQVACSSGEPAELVEVIEGSGPVTVTIDSRIAQATAAGTITATRSTFDGCTGLSGEAVVPVDVALSLTATGAVVRSVDTRFQVRPGEGSRVTASPTRPGLPPEPRPWETSRAPWTWQRSPEPGGEGLSFLGGPGFERLRFRQAQPAYARTGPPGGPRPCVLPCGQWLWP